jgi:rhodanese-related sulfurtransferase
MRTGLQLAIIATISLAAVGLTYLAKGPPTRSHFCDPATRKADEICLSEITPTDGLLWIDARSRAAWQKNGLPESVLWNLDSTEDMQAFEANNAEKIAAAQMVVIYCGDENCGTSRQIADRIRQLDLGPQVLVLHGGWRALRDAGRVGE